jgi:NurA-like 5'-3' nuclease
MIFLYGTIMYSLTNKGVKAMNGKELHKKIDEITQKFKELDGFIFYGFKKTTDEEGSEACCGIEAPRIEAIHLLDVLDEKLDIIKARELYNQMGDLADNAEKKTPNLEVVKDETKH